MTPVEVAMAFLLGLTVLTGISIVALPGDPLRLTRVLLAVASALVFQLHVVMEGARPEHWPLYAVGLVVLLLVTGHWFWGQRKARTPGPEDDA